MRAMLGVLFCMMLAACGTPPKEHAPLGPEDCSVQALGGVGEVSGGFGSVFDGAASGRGGSLTVRNADKCDEVNVYSQTPNGTMVCIGDWCPDSPPDRPLTVTPEQMGRVVREVVNDFETPPPTTGGNGSERVPRP